MAEKKHSSKITDTTRSVAKVDRLANYAVLNLLNLTEAAKVLGDFPTSGVTTAAILNWLLNNTREPMAALEKMPGNAAARRLVGEAFIAVTMIEKTAWLLNDMDRRFPNGEDRRIMGAVGCVSEQFATIACKAIDRAAILLGSNRQPAFENKQAVLLEYNLLSAEVAHG